MELTKPFFDRGYNVPFSLCFLTLQNRLNIDRETDENELKKTLYIGFDFSINKPACTILTNEGIEKMFFWPLELPSETEDIYKSVGIYVYNRNLPKISKKEYKGKNHELVREHTIRSKELAKIICNDITNYIDANYLDADIYIASEGLSFNSKGAHYIDLATYKGVFLSYLTDIYPLEKIYTFSPITLKATAGCNKGEKKGKKDAMIHSYVETAPEGDLFRRAIEDGTLKNTVNYKVGVDDLTDSYFCALTLKNEIENTLA